MKAIVFEKPKQTIDVVEIKTPAAAADQQVVDVQAASLNHRDVWMTYGAYPGLKGGVIAGSCGAGVVGNRDVVINPNNNWGPNPAYPDHTSYSILGMPVDGTFAEHIVVGRDRLHDKPAHLSMHEAAALPLAGLTAWRALFGKAQARAGDRVLISGVGGGVALLACQFAIAAGCKVFVTSSDPQKIQKSQDLGAVAGANYKDEGWAKTFAKNHGGVDVVIDSAGGQGFDQLLKICNPQARIVVYGGTRGNALISPQALFWKELQIFGSTMGNDIEFADMLAFVAKHKIHPVIDTVYPFNDAALAYQRMDAGDQFGKLVLDIGA